MVQGKACIFDTSALVYIYQHSKRSDAHSLLFRNKKDLEMDFVLASNDLAKDLPGPLQTKYLNRIRVLFTFRESPRDDDFENIKQIAIDNKRISQVDIDDDKLTDLDIIRLAQEYHREGKQTLVITDDEGIHKLAKDLGDEIEVQYTHLFFLKLLAIIDDDNDKREVQYNIQDSYYYLNNYLKQSNRELPYEKVINTSIELLTKGFLGKGQKQNTLQENIEEYLTTGAEKRSIIPIKPILEIMRKKRVDPDFCTEKACLTLMRKLQEVTIDKPELSVILNDIVHKEFASYHLELADNNHKDLNLAGALAHIRAAAKSLAFLKGDQQDFEKSLEELFYIEALLLLELDSTTEALTYLEQFLGSRVSKGSDILEYRSVAESLLVIFDAKIGLIKDASAKTLLALSKEAQTIPNQTLTKQILSKMVQDDRLDRKYRKQAAEEIVHLVNLRVLLKENPIVVLALELLGKEIDDRTNTPPDKINLDKVRKEFEGKIAKPYRGPWEISEIRQKRKATWVYTWNERLKSFWVLQFPRYYEELDKAKTITFLSGEILDYKNPMPADDLRYRQRIIFDKDPVFVIDEKRALPLW
ncbi:MAG: hypothetical protein HZR80_00885 [Candidatus Heimdallarchaeota archaeon]